MRTRIISMGQPSVVLVGFKLEHSENRDYLLDRAYKRMDAWNADYVVANPSSSLNGETSIHYIVSKYEDDVVIAENKKETAYYLIDILTKHFKK